ncbi:hypothetical protein JOC73_001750 [Alkaliphilus hydrothermalis]|uniref:Uncharacterized protein n=1 Tax=Alkaliphilus hydrothermalis TaxID=1482730 RepID=A0ABS2NQF3_9FIRM|nr:hypothetical protein [Alkaliphilus hydrothermalis]
MQKVDNQVKFKENLEKSITFKLQSFLHYLLIFGGYGNGKGI